MMELLTALGLMLVIEGALYALFPDAMKDVILRMAALPSSTLRAGGLGCALFGFVIVMFLKGF